MLWLRKRLLKKSVVTYCAILSLSVTMLFAMEDVSPTKGVSPAKQIIQHEIGTLASEIKMLEGVLRKEDMTIDGSFKYNHKIHSFKKRKSLCEIVLASDDSKAQIALAELIVTERTGPLRFELTFKKRFEHGTPLNEQDLEWRKKKIQRYLNLQKALLEQKTKAQQSTSAR